MKKIIDYQIIGIDNKPWDLASDVKKQMSFGWQPWGEVVVDLNAMVLYQVMVKYED